MRRTRRQLNTLEARRPLNVDASTEYTFSTMLHILLRGNGD